MNKYTREDLRAKALIVLQARDRGDTIWIEFLMAMMLRTGLEPSVIEDRIERLAHA